MKQVTQTLRTGEIEVNEVPIPELSDKFVLVKNLVSVISAGTEKTKVDMGNKNLFQKAKARPDLVKQVLNKLKTEGFKKTLQTVNSRLDSPSPLGYSSAGEVIAVGKLVEGLKPGDRVACAGAGYANHAEVVAIPKNLVVKIPDTVSFEEAAFATIGSIALQGLRLAEPKMGETFLVLGLGLIGQITIQLLRANGCQAIGVDLNQDLVELASKYGCQGVSSHNAVREILNATDGKGVDGVLICAGTESNQPIEMCGEVTREKGRVVVIGAVRMDIPREPFFLKEISVVISRSYGPGRYDTNYEEAGNDYPFSYVRFTEQRNMSTFLVLLKDKKMLLESLITHRFDLNDADNAYKIIEGEKREPYLGILLNYDPDTKFLLTDEKIKYQGQPLDKNKIQVSFYGAGNYATASLLPLLKNNTDIELFGLSTASGRTAQGVAKQFNFKHSVKGVEALVDQNTDLLVITTRHNTHADAVIKGISSGKHVYAEKPLALTIEELKAIDRVVIQNPQQLLMVGFNRRFAPATLGLKDFFADSTSAKMINIRVNAGTIPKDHWIHDPEIGGGRIIGEACHFIDLAACISGSQLIQVFAKGMQAGLSPPLLDDNVSITLSFADGSVANIIYTSEGSSGLAKEAVEVHCAGRSAYIDDFKELRLYSSDGKQETKKMGAQDKGQANMLNGLVRALKDGTMLVPYHDLMLSSLASILVIESMQTNQAILVDESLVK